MARLKLVWISLCAGILLKIRTIDSSSGHPPKPQSVEVRVEGILERQYYAQWRVPRTTPGPVHPANVSYTVRFRQEQNCSHQKAVAMYGCEELTTRRVGAFDEFQCKVKTQTDIPVNDFNVYCDYNVSVVANSSGGVTESDVVSVPLPMLATPLPPLDFTVDAADDQKIIVSWKRRNNWISYTVEYWILYHAAGESSNQTQGPVRNEQHTTIRHVKPFKSYSLYLRAVVLNNGQAAASDIIGPAAVFTPAGVPKPAPAIVKDEPSKLPNPSLRNVTIFWQKPSYEAWGGQPGYFRIYYKVHTTSKGNSSRSNYTLQSMNNTQLNMTVLTGLQSGLNYDIYMVMCNTAGKCGPRGLEYTIKALPTGDQPGKQDQTPIIIIVAVILVVGTATAILCGALYYWRRRTKDPDPPTDQEDLDVFEPELPCEPYDDPTDSDGRNEYQSLSQDQNCDAPTDVQFLPLSNQLQNA